MLIHLEPGYQMFYFPLECFRLHEEWMFPDSWVVRVVSPFPPPDSRGPYETRLLSARGYRIRKLLEQIMYAEVLEILRNQTRGSVKN